MTKIDPEFQRMRMCLSGKEGGRAYLQGRIKGNKQKMVYEQIMPEDKDK